VSSWLDLTEGKRKVKPKIARGGTDHHSGPSPSSPSVALHFPLCSASSRTGRAILASPGLGANTLTNVLNDKRVALRNGANGDGECVAHGVSIPQSWVLVKPTSCLRP
jgi:hypothetical protein